MDKRILIVILVFVFCALGLFVFINNQKKNEVGLNLQTNSPSSTATSSPTPKSQAFNMEEISKHNSPTDCWFSYEGGVYDVTAHIADGRHPGKEAILLGCGKDATELFNKRPGDGEPHSNNAKNMLPKYQIGVLSN